MTKPKANPYNEAYLSRKARKWALSQRCRLSDSELIEAWKVAKKGGGYKWY